MFSASVAGRLRGGSRAVDASSVDTFPNGFKPTSVVALAVTKGVESDVAVLVVATAAVGAATLRLTPSPLSVVEVHLDKREGNVRHKQHASPDDDPHVGGDHCQQVLDQVVEYVVRGQTWNG
ncbi:hypothetical protein ON010_g4164 [Phytophthora cinnamomi]|nr:hypothetical protein ON010_g4164 [Phytophthora cinnamomi]